MRKLLLLVLLTGSFQLIANTSTNILNQFTQLNINEQSGYPWYGQALHNCNIKANEFPLKYATEIMKSDKTTFELLSSETDEFGMKHDKYRQYYAGIKVLHGCLFVHSKNDIVESFNGNIYKVDYSIIGDINNFKPNWNFILSQLNYKQYAWQNAEMEANLKLQKNDPNATYFPSAEIVFAGTFDKVYGGVFIPCYSFKILALEPYNEELICASLEHNSVRYREPLICDADSNGTGNTFHRGVKPMVIDYVNSSTGYRLRNTAKNSATYNGAVGTDFTNSSKTWNTTADRPAYDVHWGAGKVYDFITNQGYNSYDNNGGQLVSIISSGSSGNAFWSLGANTATFLTGSTSSVNPCNSLDVVGHEFGHGIADEVSGLSYSGEGCMLHESFADINGQNVEWFADSTKANWWIGEEVWPSTNGIRNMKNPHSFSHPKNYGGTFWSSGGCHNPGEVQNYLYYLLAHGDSGTNDFGYVYKFKGLGRTKANKIYYYNMRYYVTSGHQFKDMAKTVIKSARDIYGQCSDEFKQVSEAWKIVNVPDTSFKVDYTHGITAPPVICNTVPATVTFKSVGDAGRACKWIFAANDTAYSQNANKTYSSTGVKKVKLITKICSKSFLDSISVKLFLQPEAKYSMLPTTLCQSATDSIYFTNTTVNKDAVQPLYWQWNAFGTSVTTNSKNFVLSKNLPPDKYTIVLRATYDNACTDTFSTVISIKSNPISNFTIKNSCYLQELKINNNTDTNSAVLQFNWLIGTKTSNLYNPTNVTLTSGTFDVKLTTTNVATGCSNSLTKSIEIYSLPKPQFTLSNICRESKAMAINKTTHARPVAYFNWNLPNSWKPYNKDTIQFIVPKDSLGLTIGLTVVDEKGCFGYYERRFKTEYMYVDFTADTICNGLITTFKNLSTYSEPNPAFGWVFKDYIEGSATSVNPKFQFTKFGNIPVELTVLNSQCAKTVTKNIFVKESPKANFSFNNICSNDSATFKNKSTASFNLTYKWYLGQGLTSTETDTKAKYNGITSNTKFDVSLVSMGSSGCKDSISKKLSITKSPSVVFVINKTGDKKYSFTNNSTFSNTYKWDFGDGITSTNKNETHFYDLKKPYTIKLVATGDSGCTGFSEQVLDVTSKNKSVLNSPVTIYPNPNKGVFVIANLITNKYSNLAIVDATGKSIAYILHKTGTDVKIEIKNVSSGIYFVKIDEMRIKILVE